MPVFSASPASLRFFEFPTGAHILSPGQGSNARASKPTSKGVTFGANGDVPVAADYDGDTQSEIAVFRPSNGTWYIYNLVTGTSSGVAFGQSGDKPVPGDYDNDGKTDVAVFRPSTGSASANWYLQPTYLPFTAIAFGASGDIPVPYSN